MSYPSLTLPQMTKSGTTTDKSATFKYYDAEVIDFERQTHTEVSTRYVTVGNMRSTVTVPQQSVSVSETLKAFVRFDNGKEVSWFLPSNVDVRKGAILRGFFVDVEGTERWVGCENLNTSDGVLEWADMAYLLDGTKKKKLVTGDNFSAFVNGKTWHMLVAILMMAALILVGAGIVGGVVGAVANWLIINFAYTEYVWENAGFFSLAAGFAGGFLFFAWSMRRFLRRTFGLRKSAPALRQTLWDYVSEARKINPFETAKQAFSQKEEVPAE